MKKKTVSTRLSICVMLLIALISGCIFIQTGCNNSGAQSVSHAPDQNRSTNWITMDITFKPNTSEEFREQAIRAIEKMWIKSAAPVMKKYPNLYPSISVTKMPFLDTLKYRLSLLETYYSKSASGDHKPITTAKIITPPCCSGPVPMCPCLCPACDSTNGRVSSMYNIAKMTFEK